MLRLALVLLVVALLAGVFGFGFVSSEFMYAAKIVFFVFIVLAVLSFLAGGYRRRGFWE